MTINEMAENIPINKKKGESHTKKIIHQYDVTGQLYVAKPESKKSYDKWVGGGLLYMMKYGQAE